MKNIFQEMTAPSKSYMIKIIPFSFSHFKIISKESFVNLQDLQLNLLNKSLPTNDFIMRSNNDHLSSQPNYDNKNTDPRDEQKKIT